MPLPTTALPLPPNGPPSGYDWGYRTASTVSSSTAFDTGLKNRDKFLGVRRCVVCGFQYALHNCFIIRQPETWASLQQRNWLPSRKESPTHEPRNGLTLCANHHVSFDAYDFFIRFIPETSMFLFVNYSNQPHLQQFHGTVIGIDIDDVHAPFPAAFIIHEMRVRGFHPFQPIQPDLPDEISFVDWIDSEDLFDYGNNGFKRKKPPPKGSARKKQKHSSQTPRKLDPLNATVIADILAATRAMPSWKACQIEDTSWKGTAEENIQKYVSSIGVEEED